MTASPTRAASAPRRVFAILLTALLFTVGLVAPASADGEGSSPACAAMPGNSDSQQDVTSVTAPTGKIIAQICIRAGQIHTDVITSNGDQTGTYEKNVNFPDEPYSYTVSGIGTGTVTVTANEGPGVSHIDDVLGDAPVPPQPADIVVHGDWVDGTIVCDATTVQQTRTVTTTPYVIVDNAWVAGTPVETIDTQTRILDQNEIIDCPPGDKPADIVVHGDWVDGTIVCDATTVQQTRTVTTTPYVIVDNAWVAGTPVEAIETRTRDLTDAEIATSIEDCDTSVLPLPPITPPDTTPPVDTPPGTTPPVDNPPIDNPPVDTPPVDVGGVVATPAPVDVGGVVATPAPVAQTPNRPAVQVAGVIQQRQLPRTGSGDVPGLSLLAALGLALGLGTLRSTKRDRTV